MPTHIHGVEITQGTQYFRWRGVQGSGYAADNSVPLVANKSTALRVYVSTTWPATRVTGNILYGNNNPPITPSNGPIEGRQESSIDRGNVNHTLNFYLPSHLLHDKQSFMIFTSDPDNFGPVLPWRPWPPLISIEDIIPIDLNFQSVPMVRVYGVLIHYTGRGLNIPPPSEQDFFNALAWASQVYPISGFNYTGFTRHDFSGDLTVNNSGICGAGWDDLMKLLKDLKGNSSDIYVGLLPQGVPNSGIVGCGYFTGVAAGYVNDGVSLAHEIGHALKRSHSPAKNPPPPVAADYPTYDGYPSGSIGEFGFNHLTSQVYDPQSTFDFMSYASNRWIAPYTFIGLKNEIASRWT